jgi:hypothetical protein
MVSVLASDINIETRRKSSLRDWVLTKFEKARRIYGGGCFAVSLKLHKTSTR